MTTKITLFLSLQVYAWGDNDHGQQGNGSTSVNRRPHIVIGLEEVKITRVACGSSHSIAWCDINTHTPVNHEPVPYPVSEDRLGSHFVTARCSSEPKVSSGKSRKQRPSLTKIVLALRKKRERQQAFGHILSALQIHFAREAVVSSLSRTSTPSEMNADSSESQNSDTRVSPSTKSIDLSVIPQATLSEVVLSNVPSDVSLDELSKQLGIKDAEFLVDVLKLAVAHRTSEDGKQSVSTVLKELAEEIPEVCGGIFFNIRILRLESNIDYVLSKILASSLIP